MKKPIFARRHYEATAETLRKVPSVNCWGTWMNLVEEFVRTFQGDNPGFKPERFRKACGIMER